MKAPHHNLLIDKVFTCNSHGIGYGKLSYITAWTKIHFPLEYYAAALRQQDETGGKKEAKIDEKEQVIKEMNEFGITLKPPSIKHPCIFYDVYDSNTIYTGIANTKDIGEYEANLVISYIKEYTELNWIHLLFYLTPQVKSRTFENLCLLGFFGDLGLSRERMVYEYQTYDKLTVKEINWLKGNISQIQNLEHGIELLIGNFEAGNKNGIFNAKRLVAVKDFLKTLKNPPHPLDDTPILINKHEKRLLTVPLTYSDIEARTLCGIYTNTTCKEFNNGKNSKNMNIAVSISRLKEIVTKNGQKMAFLTCSDDSGELECVVFPDIYEEYIDLLQNKNTVLITGERSKQSFNITKVQQI